MAQVNDSRKKGSNRQTLPLLAMRDQVHFPGVISTVHVVREASLAAVKEALEGHRLLFVASQLDMSVDMPSAQDLAEMGTVSELIHSTPAPDGGVRLVLRGVSRAKLVCEDEGSAQRCVVEQTDSVQPFSDAEGEAARRLILEKFARLVESVEGLPAETYQSVAHISEPGALMDACIHYLQVSHTEKQHVLNETSISARLRVGLAIFDRELQLASLRAKLESDLGSELQESQRQLILREQIRLLQKELGEFNEREAERRFLLARIEPRSLPEHVVLRLTREIERLAMQPSASSEGAGIRAYIDSVLEIPWENSLPPRIDYNAASNTLDRTHQGMREAKTVVRQALASMVLGGANGANFLFVGPPGVGKTGFARAVAEALGRPFARISLGGLRDEAEIRGHRRTYVGAMPGRIAQALRTTGSMCPVIVLDELDKLPQDARGGVESALLEVLDGEQNRSFRDHYLELDLDLSGVLFIATANDFADLPAALIDRFERVEFPSYSDQEKLEIAEATLVPRALAEAGLPISAVIPTAEIMRLISESREPGMRGVERALRRHCRAMALESVSGVAAQKPPHFEHKPRVQRQGVSWGLAVGPMGGVPIEVESVLLAPKGESGTFVLTGNLGSVMQESALASLSAVRMVAPQLTENDIHLHVASIGVHKDGPSAGLALALSLYSAVSGKLAPIDVASSAEISPSGTLTPVGAVREKLLSAAREGFAKVVLAGGNRAEAEAVLKELGQPLELVFVEHFSEALECLKLR